MQSKKGGAHFRSQYLTPNMASLDQFLMHVMFLISIVFIYLYIKQVNRSIKECDGELLSVSSIFILYCSHLSPPILSFIFSLVGACSFKRLSRI